MNIFEQAYLNLLNEDNNLTQREELLYLKKVLNKYWDVDDQTIQQIDNIINKVDPTTNKSKFNKNKIEYINTIKKDLYQNIDAVEGIVDNNGARLAQISKYIDLQNQDVAQRLNLLSLAGDGGYVSAETLSKALASEPFNFNIDRETLNAICKLSPVLKGRGVGKGEVLCKTLLNISQAENKGDGLLDGKPDEVIQIKAYSARIKGAQQYGQWSAVLNYFKETLHIDFGKKNCKDVCNQIVTSKDNFGLTEEQLINAFHRLLVDDCYLNNENVVHYRDDFIKSLIGNYTFEEETPDEETTGNTRKLTKKAEKEKVKKIQQQVEGVWQENLLKLCLAYYKIVDKWKYMIIVDNEDSEFKGLYISSDFDDIVKHMCVVIWPTGSDDRAGALAIAYKTPPAPTDQAK